MLTKNKQLKAEAIQKLTIQYQTSVSNYAAILTKNILSYKITINLTVE